MMSVAIFLVALLGAAVSHAGILTLCIAGDTQEGVRCDNHADAWLYQKAAIDWIVNDPTFCDVVIFPGDLVDGRDYSSDCWCAAQPYQEDCTTLQNPYTLQYCDALECGNAEANACVGGDGYGDSGNGWYCEWSRVRSLLDSLEVADIPYITVAGNHDTDNRTIPDSCERTFDEYNSYFGEGRMSQDFVEHGVFKHTIPCTELSGNVAYQAHQSYHVLNAAGTQWLLIALGWIPESDATLTSGTTEASIEWAQGIIGEYPDMPTILIAHMMIATSCARSEYDNAWCSNAGTWQYRWTGKAAYDYLMGHPQVVATLGGHIRKLDMAMSSSTTHAILGAAIDYTTPAPPTYPGIIGGPAWYFDVEHGGGGVIQIIRMNTATGQISSKAYSDKAKSDAEGDGTGWFDVWGEEGSNWARTIVLCGDDVRFDIPNSACPRLAKPPEMCCQ